MKWMRHRLEAVQELWHALFDQYQLAFYVPSQKKPGERVLLGNTMYCRSYQLQSILQRTTILYRNNGYNLEVSPNLDMFTWRHLGGKTDMLVITRR